MMVVESILIFLGLVFSWLFTIASFSLFIEYKKDNDRWMMFVSGVTCIVSSFNLGYLAHSLSYNLWGF